MKKHAPLSFNDYLIQLPPAIVFDGLLKQSDLPRRIISSSMVSEISLQFSSEKNLAQRFMSLSENARFSCSLAYLFDNPGLAFECALHRADNEETPVSPAVRKTKDASETQQHIFIDELIKSFLVFGARNEFGKMFFVGFKEFEPKLRKLCCQTIVERTQVSGEKEVAGVMAGLFLNDVTTVVGIASQALLKRTKLGTLGKASSHCLNKVLHFTHAPFDCPRINDQTPVLPLFYAIKRQLVYEVDDGYTASHGRMLEWLLQPLIQRSNDFVEFAFESVSPWGKSFFVEMFHKSLNPWLSAQKFGEKLTSDVAAAAKTLAYCGLADVQKTGGHTIFTRSAQGVHNEEALGKSLKATRIVLMPDFSAMIPQEISPEHLYWFTKLGELVSLDKVYKGIINRDIINKSLSAGITGDVLLDWLGRWQSPNNVIETVKEWIREFSRISLEMGSFVVSAEEKVTKQLLSYAPLKNALEPLTGHCIFRVIPGRENQVNEILVAMGYDVRTPRSMKREHERLGIDWLKDEHPDQCKLFPIVEAAIPSVPLKGAVAQGKYSSQLKALDMTDLLHVVDYAILMGHTIRFEYSGSPYIKKGEYRVRPISYKKGTQPVLEAETIATKKNKIFLIERIIKIGVEPVND